MANDNCPAPCGAPQDRIISATVPNLPLICDSSDSDSVDDDEQQCSGRYVPAIGTPYRAERRCRTAVQEKRREAAIECVMRVARECRARKATGSDDWKAHVRTSTSPYYADRSEWQLQYPPTLCRGGLVTLFDWDDTLFPTHHLMDIAPQNRSHELDVEGVLAEEPHRHAFRSHAAVVDTLLREATRHGRVGIVTLARRPWVQNSARYLADLDLPKLCEDLQIPVVYARECCRRSMAIQAQCEDGVDVLTVMKCRAMLKVLRKLYGKGPWLNVISIGDSFTERDALKEVLWNREEMAAGSSRCKTVKLMDQPSVAQLSDQLVLVSSWIESMASHDDDFDVVMDELGVMES